MTTDLKTLWSFSRRAINVGAPSRFHGFLKKGSLEEGVTKRRGKILLRLPHEETVSTALLNVAAPDPSHVISTEDLVCRKIKR